MIKKPRKRSRAARAKAMSLKARKRLLVTLLDSALAGLPTKHVNKIAETLVNRALTLVENTYETDEVILLHPAAEATRLLNAIGEHMEATDEDSDSVVTRLIACLGSQAAAGAQPN